jgi:hypothetical protein
MMCWRDACLKSSVAVARRCRALAEESGDGQVAPYHQHGPHTLQRIVASRRTFSPAPSIMGRFRSGWRNTPEQSMVCRLW